MLRALYRHALGFHDPDNTVLIRCQHCGDLNLIAETAHLFRCWNCRHVSDGPKEMLVEFEEEAA